MGTLWFWIVAFMLAAYVVLDGFDIGVGVVYLLVAKTETERSQALRAIGPVWDGNEVWLLAAGGTMFFAFPLLYASSFSGFYLPLMMVLWLLILRGLSVELRGHLQDPLWRSFFDVLFFLSSTALAIFFGAALANVVRGVPLGPDNYFFLPLWTDWKPGPHPGILDWYTVLGGVLAVVALALHGSLYLAVKTEGGLEHRALKMARRLGPAVAVLTLVSIPATVVARPNSLHNYETHPAAFLAPVAAFVGLVMISIALRKRAALRGFGGSCLYLASMLGGAAAGLVPVLLPCVGTEGQDLTIDRALAGAHTLRVGLVWWSIGIALALFYFCVVYWLFRGKVPQEADGYGH